jgi:phage baseplate assembly protein W
MKSLCLDPGSRDLVFDDRMGLQMVSGTDEAAQHLRLLLTTRMGEWFLNIRHGLDHGEILGQKMPAAESRIRAAVYDAVKQDSRDIRIQSLDLEHDVHARTLTIRITATVDETFAAVEVQL